MEERKVESVRSDWPFHVYAGLIYPVMRAEKAGPRLSGKCAKPSADGDILVLPEYATCIDTVQSPCLTPNTVSGSAITAEYLVEQVLCKHVQRKKVKSRNRGGGRAGAQL